MAIVEMRKLNLAAMSYDRDKILDALQKTGSAEVKEHTEVDNLSPCTADAEGLREYVASLEAALNLLCAEVDNRNKENKVKSDILKDGFDVSYSDFMSSDEKKDFADELVSKINSLTDEKLAVNAELSRVQRTLAAARIYSSVNEPLSEFSDTKRVCVRLGTIPANERDNFSTALSALPLAAYKEVTSTAEEILIIAAAHKSIASDFDGILSSASFTLCPFSGDSTGKEVYESALARKNDLCARLEEISGAMYDLKDGVRPLKVYCDYLLYKLEKAELSEKFLATERTFLLEAYVPKGCEQVVETELKGATGAVYYEFTDPAEDEVTPTLMHNNKVVSNFETITNMYSVPSSHEFDPNTVMAFFYSLFLGFIMADIGYGILMLFGGGFIWYKKRARDSGLKRLSGVFAVGGIFTILWGVLFNSFFGFSIFPFDIMPTAILYSVESIEMSMWSILGTIQIPAVLVIALLIGIVQLGAGYLCKAVQWWCRGKILDGILDGVVWTVFSAGVALAVIGLIDDFNITILAYVGGIMAAASLVIAMLTAGRHEKVLGKFTKGFGAAYGIINFLSDVLSYARLYGLMLSGAVISQIISVYSATFITETGGAFIVIGVLLFIVGHVFNIAISLLGAYIHDARLQYVEFYGKFYEGEGELFKPVGSRHKYIYLKV